MLNSVDKILEFVLKEQKKRGQGLKILTPNQNGYNITNFFSTIKSRKQF